MPTVPPSALGSGEQQFPNQLASPSAANILMAAASLSNKPDPQRSMGSPGSTPLPARPPKGRAALRKVIKVVK